MKSALQLSIIITVFSILFSSCASTSKSTVEKDQAAKEFKNSTEKGSVYLYRTGRAVGAAAQTQIKINGQDAGGTGPGTFFKWDLTPGTYAFSCNTSESSAAVEVDVKAGELYYIRQDNRLGLNDGRVTLKVVDDKKGQKEIQDCKLLVSTYQE